MFYELEIGGVVYKLRLTTRALVTIEKELGYNPIQMFMNIAKDNIPRLADILIIFHGMLISLQHGITLDKTYDIFDKYTEEGHTQFDLIPVFSEVFTMGGFMSNAEEEEVEESKNA